MVTGRRKAGECSEKKLKIQKPPPAHPKHCVFSRNAELLSPTHSHSLTHKMVNPEVTRDLVEQEWYTFDG